MPQSLRIFLALELPLPVVEKARDLISRLSQTPAKVRWVEREFHLTLHFLGETDLSQVPAICEATRQAVGEIRPFEFSIGGTGAFPSAARARTIWLGASRGIHQLTALHASLEQKLRPLGYRGEARRFQPHVTLGRVRGPAGLAELGRLVTQNADFEAGPVLADEVVVFSSELDSTGPTYTQLGRGRLGHAIN